MNNTNFKKLGTTIALLALLGVLGYVKYHNFYVQDAQVQVETSTPVSVATKAISVDKTTHSNNISLPEEPVNGKLKGVVLFGASGFDSFVVNVDSQKRYKVVSKKFGDSLAIEGLVSTDDVKTTLKKYLGIMLNKGVDSKNLHFIVSSGALKEPKTKLIAQGIRESGFVVNEITPEQEGKLAFQAAMNLTYASKAFVVDVGSGNTKIAWLNGSTISTVEASGAKYFQLSLQDKDVFDELASKSSRIPSDKRSLCFLIGGVPSSLAKQTVDASRYSILQPLEVYNPGDDKKIASGLNILKAIQSVTNTTFVFDNDANFAIGFLMSLKY